MGEIIVRVGLKEILAIPVTMNDVFSIVKKQFNIEAFVVGRRGRCKAAMVTAKFVFSYYCHTHLSVSYTQIGNFMGLHRTAINRHIAAAENYLRVEDEEFCNALKTLEQNIESFKLQNI